MNVFASTATGVGLPLTAPALAPWISSFVAAYLLAVRLLRYQRVRALEKENASIKSNLSPAQAQKIIQVPLFIDLPYLALRSQEFALFKTYGIPTISRQLNQTKQLAKQETISKRYVDTAVLIATWLSCPISGPGSGVVGSSDEIDPRNAIAVARVNWLHAHYQISNDDFLYTLSVFIYEPVRWTEQFGWRGFSSLECDAIYIYWAEIGRRMGIKDIPPSYDEFKAWSEEYERNNMVPDENNAKIAEYTIGLLLHKVPNVLGLKSFGRRVVICLLGERLREAMMLPEQPKLLISTVRNLLQLHGFFCRNFCLPRIKPHYFVHPDAQPCLKTKNGKDTGPARGHPGYYENDPWYKPESTGFRKFLEKIQVVVGLARPEDLPGPHRLSEGYRLEETGPMTFSKAGHEKVMKMAEILQGSPVKGPWSLDYVGGCPMGAHS